MAWHKLQHLMGWNTGNVISLKSKDGNITRYYVAFRCSQCGQVSGVQQTMTYRNNSESATRGEDGKNG